MGFRQPSTCRSADFHNSLPLGLGAGDSAEALNLWYDAFAKTKE